MLQLCLELTILDVRWPLLFFSETYFIYNYLHIVQKWTKNQCGKLKKIQDFCPRDMESCHLSAARRVKLWLLNANLFFEEPHQLTKFAWQVHWNHILQRRLPFKALIAIFWDLQPLWSPSLTEPDLLRFGCFSGHVLSKTKSVTPQFVYISDITNSSSFNGKIFRKKSMLENFRANVLKVTMHLQINNFLQIWIFESKYWSKCDL